MSPARTVICSGCAEVGSAPGASGFAREDQRTRGVVGGEGVRMSEEVPVLVEDRVYVACG